MPVRGQRCVYKRLEVRLGITEHLSRGVAMVVLTTSFVLRGLLRPIAQPLSSMRKRNGERLLGNVVTSSA